MDLELGQTEVCGTHELTWCALGGAAPELVAPWWPPPVDLFTNNFYIFHKNSPKSFVQFREVCFLHKNNTMVVLLKIAPVRVSFIQIMQIRVQNKSKSVWKSRYDGDVSSSSSNVGGIDRVASHKWQGCASGRWIAFHHHWIV